LAAFTKLTAEFAFGKENPLVKNGQVATVQAISGTGALRVGAEFLNRFMDPTHPRLVFIPDPSYVNHTPIFANSGFEIQSYSYYNPKTNGLDLNGLLEDAHNAPDRSVFLLHACAHNPTGIDPTFEQWKELSPILLKKNIVCFFDTAYQGFASGSPDKDGAAFRYFAEKGHEILVAQSYSKNFGLYGQRVGALNIITQNKNQTEIVMSQLNQVIRPMYSNPPLHGARIVSTVFGDEKLNEQWKLMLRQWPIESSVPGKR